jgi:uncharacterized protein YidB (DUF937 family)
MSDEEKKAPKHHQVARIEHKGSEVTVIATAGNATSDVITELAKGLPDLFMHLTPRGVTLVSLVIEN